MYLGERFGADQPNVKCKFQMNNFCLGLENSHFCYPKKTVKNTYRRVGACCQGLARTFCRIVFRVVWNTRTRYASQQQRQGLSWLGTLRFHLRLRCCRRSTSCRHPVDRQSHHCKDQTRIAAESYRDIRLRSCRRAEPAVSFRLRLCLQTRLACL